MRIVGRCRFARVAELADAYGSGPYGATRGGSSPLASNVSFYSAGVWLTGFFSKRTGQPGTPGHEFESTDLPTPTFSSCRPPSFHQLGKPLSTSRSNSTFLRGRRCFCLALYPCPTSFGRSRKFGTSRSRHRAAATFGSCRACTRTCQD
jgi:hypothetical protein